MLGPRDPEPEPVAVAAGEAAATAETEKGETLRMAGPSRALNARSGRGSAKVA